MYSGLAVGVRNATAQAASLTAEGMANYYNFLDNLDEASSQGHYLTTRSDPGQIELRDISKYSEAVEQNILPFLKLYGYDELHASVLDQYASFLEQLAKADVSEAGNVETTGKYLALGNLFCCLIATTRADFGFEADEEVEPKETSEAGTGEENQDRYRGHIGVLDGQEQAQLCNGITANDDSDYGAVIRGISQIQLEGPGGRD
ncbi:hypothetical protein DRE_00920 [Drechslerella stenobrocha 248]|uniref:Uncharacterized protein n=1 Tax=Drechslerella stenobrocha 248 TaxID=1043628 RepID=W7HLI4_9PEZI|nr:hypothetical protein DRE_00920 [Drechslerella stenobrocha 248]